MCNHLAVIVKISIFAFGKKKQKEGNSGVPFFYYKIVWALIHK